MGRELFLMIVSLSISGTILGIVLFLVKKLLKKRVPMTWQYYIWIVLLLRMLLPFAPEINVTGYLFKATEKAEANPPIAETKKIQKTEPAAQITTGDIEFVPPEQPIEQKVRQPAANTTKLDFETENNRLSIYLPALVWIIGALLLFIIKLMDYLNFTRYIKASNQEITDEKTLSIMDDVLMDQGIRKNIRIYQNKLVISPMLAGFLHPFVVLPEKLEITQNLSFVIAHELMHYKRKDILYKWFFQIVRCIHWFNPFLYFVNKNFNQACELSCDEAVIRQLTCEERKEYGNTLLLAADLSINYRNNVLSTTLIESKKYLKARLDNIMKYKKPTILSIACSLTALVFLIITAAITGAKAAPVKETAMSTASGQQSSYHAGSPISSLFYPSAFPFIKYIPEYKNSGENTVPDFAKLIFDTINQDITRGNNLKWDYKAQNKKIANQADDVYNSNALIAGQDICDNSFYYYYMKNGTNPSTGKFKLSIGRANFNGSETIAIFNVNQDTTITLDSSLPTISSGQFKLSFIDPDKKVTTIVSGTHNIKKTILLKKGRNQIKMVGRNTKMKSLDFYLYALDKNALTSWYSSEYSERAVLLMNEMQKTGNIDLNELVKCAPYLDSKDVSECIRILMKNNIKISNKQLQSLVPFANSKVLGEYLSEITKEGSKISPAQIIHIAPFLDSKDLGKILLNVLDSNIMTLNQLSDVIPFLDSDTAGKVLLSIVEDTNDFDYREFSNFYPFMNSKDLGTFFKQYVKKSSNPVVDEIINAAPFMNSEDIMDCLLEGTQKKKYINIDTLIDITPYLDSDGIAELLYQLINANQNVSIDDIVDVSPFLDSDHLAELLYQLISANQNLSMDHIVDVSPFLDSDDLAELLYQLINTKQNLSMDDVVDVSPFLDSDDLAELLYQLINTKQNLSMDHIFDLSPFLDSDDIADCMKLLIKKGYRVTNDQIIDLQHYIDEDDYIALIKSIK